MQYLLKTEPSTYSFADLEREGTTQWDGVRNPFALRNLAAMKPGDELIIYHTADEKRAVGKARVEAVDASDVHDPKVKITAGKPLPAPVTLAQMKADSQFADSPLVRQGRLSVVPLTTAQYRFITSGGKN